MARNIPATVLSVLAGAGVSMAGGGLLGVYVVAGLDPAEAAAPPRIRAERPLVDADAWPAAAPFGPVQGYYQATDQDAPDQDALDQAALDQDRGVLASGSSRL